MKSTQQLHDLGERLWLDIMTRDLLSDGVDGRASLEVSPLRANE